MRLGVEQELALGEMVDLRLAGDLQGEQPVTVAEQRFMQGRRSGGGQLGEIEPFELASSVEQLAGGDVAVDDPSGRVDQHGHQRCRLDDRIQQKLAVKQIETLATHQIAQGIVGGYQPTQLVVRGVTDADAEVPVAQTLYAVPDCPQDPRPGSRGRPCEPQREEPGDQDADSCATHQRG